MSQQGPPPPPPPPPPPGGSGGGQNRPTRNDQGWPKWTLWALLGVFVTVLLITSYAGKDQGSAISYSTFLSQAKAGKVESIQYTNGSAKIIGKYTDGKKFTTT